MYLQEEIAHGHDSCVAADKGKAGDEPGAEPEPVGEFDPTIVMMILCILIGVLVMIETWQQQEFPWPQEATPPETESRWCYWTERPAQDVPSGASSSCGASSTVGFGVTV